MTHGGKLLITIVIVFVTFTLAYLYPPKNIRAKAAERALPIRCCSAIQSFQSAHLETKGTYYTNFHALMADATGGLIPFSEYYGTHERLPPSLNEQLTRLGKLPFLRNDSYRIITVIKNPVTHEFVIYEATESNVSKIEISN